MYNFCNVKHVKRYMYHLWLMKYNLQIFSPLVIDLGHDDISKIQKQRGIG